MKLIRSTIQYSFVSVVSFFMAIVIRLYFRRWQVAKYEQIPHKGPVIFASNHQSAFLDPLVIYFSQPRRNRFLVRANIFSNPVAKFWLETLHMLPIYRVRDGIRAVSKNDEIIEKCVKILTKGNEPLVIFAEGNHNMRRALRPLQKGIARIAFSTMEANNFEIDLAIVPTGLNYGRHTRYRSDMLINFGNPIFLKQYTVLYKENPNKAYQTLVNDIFSELDKEVLSIRPSKSYGHIENEWLSRHTYNPNLIEQFKEDKKIISELSEKYKDEDLKIPEAAIKEPVPPLPSLWYRIAMFPVFLYGYINSFIGYKLLSLLIKKVVTDIHFYASIKSTINMIFGPLVFLLQSYVVYVLTGSGTISIIYFIISPFATILAFDYKFAVFERLPRMKGVAGYEF
jgi:1-acyl-sn-glycerol-3-phosphate acyltransferase